MGIPRTAGMPVAMEHNLRLLHAHIDRQAEALREQLISWRRDLHRHPELSNREFRTASLVAHHLGSLGLRVQTGVAHTGVVGVLEGAHPGPVVALRADMDALPITEALDLPFASSATAMYEGREVGVMHACGHDCHTAILMSVAQILTDCREQLHGTVKFIFQPAEESPPRGEEGGAELMIQEGVLENPAPEAIFGLHVFAGMESGTIGYRCGPAMASSDTLRISIVGRQAHGGMPWQGIDPIVVASQVVLALQTIPSRQLDVTHEPAIITLGSIQGGVRDNIIPEQVELVGTVRAFDETMRADIAHRVTRTAEKIAESAGAKAIVRIEKGYSVTVNHTALTQAMVPTLERVAGPGQVFVSPKLTGAEDFSKFQERIPGMFFFLGITPRGTPRDQVAPNHSARFEVDESALPLGVRALAHLTVDYFSARNNQVPITESGLSDRDSIPSSISQRARSG
ncbi:MAG: amidohydrolase [Betaproteobacteria bacterium]|nr:amidohydrolase [Betaproteobacteria bacterium]MDE2132094.1 amidohydrolase [Betaproteobacteria bacterium]MDE2211584.1 amidohydrolase [Betaproteobacteria bacterium]